MKRAVYRFYRVFLVALSLPIILADYFHKTTGREYGVGILAKLALMTRAIANTKRIPTVSWYVEHLVMMTRILQVPKSIEGCVVECGCYKGGSTANLSLVCALSGRQLEVFDSFRGLPQPVGGDTAHTVIDSSEIHLYSKGAFHASLEEVRGNVARYGRIEVCHFNVGFFEDTLREFNRPCVFVFEDVDLRSSLETCLIHLWPLLQPGCYFFSHEAHHMEIASVFFDHEFWHAKLNSQAPGLVGAGGGLGLNPSPGAFRSDLGYSIKDPDLAKFRKVPQIDLP